MATKRQLQIVENFIKKETKRLLKEDSKVSGYGDPKSDKLILELIKSFKKYLGDNLNQRGLIKCAEECIYLCNLHK